MHIRPNRLCAVLIPTRKRFERLKKTVESVFSTVKDRERVIVVCRSDDDDPETGERFKELGAGCYLMTGPRGRGYPEINLFYTRMAGAFPECKWVWIMNDDATIVNDNKTPDAKGWDELLAEAPSCSIVQPEIMGLGPSTYSRSEGGAFPIVPNQCWREFGLNDIPDPADTALDDLLRKGNGWKTYWLKGIKVQHNRDNDGKLEIHRTIAPV